jgi:hypothetical protein
LVKFNFKSFLSYSLFVFLGLIVARVAFSFLSPKLAPKRLHLDASKNQGLMQLKEITPVQTQTQSSAIMPSKTNLPITVIKNKITQSLTPYILNGIYFSGDKVCALINNQILEEGDRVGEATVEKITLDAVEIKVKDKTVRLSVKGK